jgi:hypothetical protein
MPADRRMSTEVVNAQAAALAALAANGYIRLYTGTRPATANAPITTQTLAATLRFGSPAFGAPVAGLLTTNATTGDPSPPGGLVTWARILKADGTSPLWDDSVGTADANIILASTTILPGVPVNLASLTHLVPSKEVAP